MQYQIGDYLYVRIVGYAGVYKFMGKLGDKLKLVKPDNHLFTLVVSPDKVVWENRF